MCVKYRLPIIEPNLAGIRLQAYRPRRGFQVSAILAGIGIALYLVLVGLVFLQCMIGLALDIRDAARAGTAEPPPETFWTATEDGL